MNFSKIVCSMSLITSLFAVAVYSMNIFLAATVGDVARVQEFLAAGAAVNQQEQDHNGWTPLDLAVRNGHKKVVQVLLAAGAAFNQKNYRGWTSLYLAVVYRKLEVAQVLLAAGADANWQDSYGRTPMRIAASTGQPEIVQALLEHGADQRIVDRQGRYPLESAVSFGHDKVANILFDSLEEEQTRRIRMCEVAPVLARSTHDRLGAESPMSLLPQYLLGEIARLSSQN